MKFKEVQSWYAEPEPYLGGVALFFMGIILWMMWQFLMPEYLALTQREQESLRLTQITQITQITQSGGPRPRGISASAQIPKFPISSSFLLKTDQASHFLQEFSTWIENQKISVEQLSSTPDPEGITFQLKGYGDSSQLIDFFNKFSEVPLLVSQINLQIFWKNPPAPSLFELSAWLPRMDEGKFTWNFVPYGWGNLSNPGEKICQETGRYQGWLSLLPSQEGTQAEKRMSNWVYRESSCSRQWIDLGNKSGNKARG